MASKPGAVVGWPHLLGAIMPDENHGASLN